MSADPVKLPPEPSAQTNDAEDIQLLLPANWNKPLWKRLSGEFKDKFAPEKLPPLQLTSRPVDVGMIQSDRVSLPWYRTVFTNLGDVISPETLPPLELESRPVDVGELIGDQMAHPWWSSLLRNLADRVAPERMPPLELTSKPMDLAPGETFMILPSWSSVIDTPKVFLPDRPKAEYIAAPRPVDPPKPDPVEVEFVHLLENDLRRDLRHSILRQRMWVAFAILEVAALIATSIWWN